MRFKSYFTIVILCYLFLCVQWFNQVYAAPPKIKEYHLKARYIEGFTAFIQWPKSIFSNSDDPLRLCVLGDNPFGKALDILVRTHNNRKNRQSHPRIIDYLRRGEETDHCHLLYISKSEKSYVQQVLAQVKDQPILTISSLKSFAISGGMIQFYVSGNKVRFFIDPQTLRNEKLHADANLLRIADLVE